MSEKAKAQGRTIERGRTTTHDPALASARPAVNPLLGFQQILGNQAMLQLLEAGAIQAKLRLSQPGDADEEEADRVAEKVVSAARVPKIQRKCACTGGTPCSKCASEDDDTIHRSAVTPVLRFEPSIQRAPAEESASPGGAAAKAAPHRHATHPLVVEDDAEKVDPHQMRKSQFIALLRTDACATADAVLKSVGRSTKGCPYIEKWLGFYEKQSGAHIEAAMRKYAPETATARSAHEAIRLLVLRIQKAALSWAKTGKVEGLPPEMASEISSGAGFLEKIHNFATTGVAGAVFGFIGGKGKKDESSGPGDVMRKAQTAEPAPAHDAAGVKAQLGGGHSLDSRVQSQMSAAFGYDFSGVRVHTDSSAAQLSTDLQARAFTIGSHVAFAPGEYRPGTLIGDALIAHELAHVVQQSGAAGAPVPQRKAQSNDKSLEEDADRSAAGAVASLWGRVNNSVLQLRNVAKPNLKSGLKLSRCDFFKSKSDEEKLEDLKKPQDAGAQDAGQADAAPPGPRNFAGEPLVDKDKAKIQEHLKKTKIAPGTVMAGVVDAKFVLHDTSSSLSAAAIKGRADVGRGPLGSGVSAYVPKSDDPTVARPTFFETRRPSTTEYEKAIEKFSKPDDAKLKSAEKAKAWKDRRDAAFRKIWAATQSARRTSALDSALTGQGLTPDEIQGEKTGNKKKKGDQDFNPGAENVLALGSKEDMTTSSSWAIEDICKQVKSSPVSTIAVSGKEKELTDTCAGLTDYFKERQAHISSVVAVEIVQPGVRAPKDKKDKVNKNTCDPTNPDIVALSNPPYSATQYESIRDMYLRAAFQAASFPEITTHFALDAFVEGHCDPRCFDLGNLYLLIAIALGHAAGSSYGVVPSYGRRWGTNNVWWDDGICHSKHP